MIVKNNYMKLQGSANVDCVTLYGEQQVTLRQAEDPSGAYMVFCHAEHEEI